MFRRLKQKLLMSVTIIALILTSVITYAESVTYEYDELNRLKKIIYALACCVTTSRVSEDLSASYRLI